MTVRRENEISRVILDAAIEVHSVLGGPGLLEGVYEEAIAYELALRGLAVERQKAVPVIYKGQRLGSDLRLDLLVEGMVLVECRRRLPTTRCSRHRRSPTSVCWT